jgi:hypothetical protein
VSTSVASAISPRSSPPASRTPWRPFWPAPIRWRNG